MKGETIEQRNLRLKRQFADYWSKSENKKNRTEFSKEQWSNPEFKSKMKSIHKERCKDENFRIQRSKKQKEKWEDENYKKQQTKNILNGCTIDTYKKRKEKMIQSWKNENIRKKRMIGIEKYHRENKEEVIARNRKSFLDLDFYYQYGTFKHLYPYSCIFNKKFKQYIRDIYENKCVITGMTNEEHKQKYGGQQLPVHHWTYNKDETTPFYFVPLSFPVHSMTNYYDKSQWIELFNNIAEEKWCELIQKQEEVKIWQVIGRELR